MSTDFDLQATVAAVAAAGGIAYATIPDKEGVIHGCQREEALG